MYNGAASPLASVLCIWQKNRDFRPCGLPLSCFGRAINPFGFLLTFSCLFAITPLALCLCSCWHLALARRPCHECPPIMRCIPTGRALNAHWPCSECPLAVLRISSERKSRSRMGMWQTSRCIVSDVPAHRCRCPEAALRLLPLDHMELARPDVMPAICLSSIPNPPCLTLFLGGRWLLCRKFFVSLRWNNIINQGISCH